MAVHKGLRIEESPRTTIALFNDSGLGRYLPALGEGNPAKAIKLDPNVFYQYIIDKRSEARPTAPVWTSVISGVPSNTAFEWKCLRRRENGTGTVTWQSGVNKFRTSESGYVGQSLGSFGQQ
ncbi:carbohydrate-binding module family 20 domain-containing protein [Nostoc sp.]|uniref:carbohydrate-binding module family 20 domain-containing protein n=1 Tax=Nostoc sp. TaxID=1180 RepID=UPI003FA5CCCB